MKKMEDPIELQLLFQELINQLPTYKEQKELYAHYEALKKEKINV